MKRTRFTTVIALSTVVASITMATGAARAEDERGQDRNDTRDAAKLFEQARDLAEAGRWAEACPRLAESLKLEANMTTEFRLADCYERIGRNASAWRHYESAANGAAAAGQLTRERFARERAKRLYPTVDRLLIVLPRGATNLDVELDGHLVPPAAVRTPLPVDPGEHTVHVWSTGMSSYDVLVKVQGNEGRTFRVDVPPLEPALPFRLGTEAKTPAPAPHLDLTPIPPAETPKRRSSLKAWGAGFGLGGLVLGGTGAGLYFGTRSGDTCGTSCITGVGLLSAGGVAVLLGTILYVTGWGD